MLAGPDFSDAKRGNPHTRRSNKGVKQRGQVHFSGDNNRRVGLPRGLIRAHRPVIASMAVWKLIVPSARCCWMWLRMAC